jgi:hypothetical protein
VQPSTPHYFTDKNCVPVAVVAITGVSTASAVTSTVFTATAFTRVAAAVATAGSHLLSGLPAILGEHNCKLAAIHLVPIQVIHSISSIATIVELNKGEATRALGVVVLKMAYKQNISLGLQIQMTDGCDYLRNIHIANVTISDKDSANLIGSHSVRQVADKQGSGGSSIAAVVSATTGIAAAVTLAISGITSAVSSTVTASISTTITSVTAVASASSTVSHLANCLWAPWRKKTGNPDHWSYVYAVIALYIV